MKKSIILEWSAKFLKDYADELDNHGCNDYTIEQTPDTEKLIGLMNIFFKKDDPDFEPFKFKNGRVIVYDWMMAIFLSKALEKVNEL